MSAIPKNIKVGRSRTGLGLFATEDISKGTFIIEYTGSVLNRREADEKGGKYLFETSRNRFIDGSSRTNIARYANHSCDPNCEIEIKRGKVFLVSSRRIKAGEELTYDYDKEYFEEYIKPVGCLCNKCYRKKTAGARRSRS